MIGTARKVQFECGHDAMRVARNGRSLVGERIYCHDCAQTLEVVSEGNIVTMPVSA